MKKIIVVDDDKKTLFLIEKMLDRSGFQSVCFEDPEEALAFVEREPRDVALVIADVAMPKLSGFDLLDEFKKRNRIREIPFLFLSALSAESLVVNAFEQGALDYLIKPVSRELLIAKVKTLLKALEDNKSRAATIIKGRLEEKPVEDVLKFCESEGLTGTLTVVQPDGTHGVLHYMRGLPDEINILNAQGECVFSELEALDQIRTWREGNFTIRRS